MSYPDSLLGRSFLRRQASRAGKVAKMSIDPRNALKVASITTRAGTHLALQSTRITARNVKKGGAVAYRVAKRLIRKIARPIVNKMLRGDMDFILGNEQPKSITPALKAAIITAVTAPATAAVAAGTVTAPAAPAVPVIIPVVLNELFDEIKKKGRKILEGKDPSSDPQADQALALQESGVSAADALQASNLSRSKFKVYAIGGSVTLGILFLFIALRKRRQNADNR